MGLRHDLFHFNRRRRAVDHPPADGQPRRHARQPRLVPAAPFRPRCRGNGKPSGLGIRHGNRHGARHFRPIVDAMRRVVEQPSGNRAPRPHSRHRRVRQDGDRAGRAAEGPFGLHRLCPNGRAPNRVECLRGEFGIRRRMGRPDRGHAHRAVPDRGHPADRPTRTHPRRPTCPIPTQNQNRSR